MKWRIAKLRVGITLEWHGKSTDTVVAAAAAAVRVKGGGLAINSLKDDTLLISTVAAFHAHIPLLVGVVLVWPHTVCPCLAEPAILGQPATQSKRKGVALLSCLVSCHPKLKWLLVAHAQVNNRF